MTRLVARAVLLLAVAGAGIATQAAPASAHIYCYEFSATLAPICV